MIEVTWQDGRTFRGQTYEDVAWEMWKRWPERGYNDYLVDLARRAKQAYGVVIRSDSAEHAIRDLCQAGVVTIQETLFGGSIDRGSKRE